jgi:hydroxyacylglutathione hydrolase
MGLEIHLLRCLSDNYAPLVHDSDSGETLLIDAPDPAPILAALEQRNWRLSQTLVTHHHSDHVQGLAAVKARTGCTVIGPEADRARVPELDTTVAEGSVLSFAGREILTLETPGHTMGHVAYWMLDESLAFVGDTLFAMGCGRILEGTPELMWRSLTKLSELPPATAVYCGHEYTLANGRFALSVDGGNEALAKRVSAVERLVGEGQATIPTTIGEELATNPFLRAGRPELARAVGLEGAPAVAVFAALRERKNRS